MVIKSARRSIKAVYPGAVFRLVVVVVVVYLIAMLFIREQSMEGTHVDIATLAVLSASYLLWECSVYRIWKYTSGVTVKGWLGHRIKEVEKDVRLNTKYGRVTYTRFFLSATGFYVFYLMAMSMTPGILNVVVTPPDIAIYLLIIDRFLGRNYRRTFRGLKDLYEQFEVEG